MGRISQSTARLKQALIEAMSRLIVWLLRPRSTSLARQRSTSSAVILSSGFLSRALNAVLSRLTFCSWAFWLAFAQAA